MPLKQLHSEPRGRPATVELAELNVRAETRSFLDDTGPQLFG
jgi:hypothetical protein